MFPATARSPDTGGPHSPSLRITTRDTAVSAVVCRLDGEADQDTRHELDVALAKAVAEGPVMLLVDLAPLSFCDSACLNALLTAQHDAEEAGVWLVLVGAGPRLRRLLEITGADRMFTLRPELRVTRPTIG
ncbi:STAS domain-containing protein [Kitasatospora sp. NPDC057965]|uniref:STAS domain-containing protein n=1 Tax=Kitasatospora sp. NPDC057965 TaxID=3346291 RepID=UPI0036D7B3CF